jgi:hypothetical protein
MSDMPDEDDLVKRAHGEARQLHDQAILLGYNVGLNIEFVSGYGPVSPVSFTYSFWVRRVDQSAGTEKTFATADEATAHLEHLATLPRYCLDLEGQFIEVVSDLHGTTTWIMDRGTGQHFGMRTADLENATQVCVHAETPPTANWHPDQG